MSPILANEGFYGNWVVNPDPGDAFLFGSFYSDRQSKFYHKRNLCVGFVWNMLIFRPQLAGANTMLKTNIEEFPITTCWRHSYAELYIFVSVITFMITDFVLLLPGSTGFHCWHSS